MNASIIGVVINPNKSPNFIHNLFGITKELGAKKVRHNIIKDKISRYIENTFKKNK
ncbi:hypothetical protein OAM62_00745 [Candidatus Pelagibacter sp.]|jgi:hypothetical protein|nr:hypothetical protein [Candidatus Pelagibacter sp.]